MIKKAFCVATICLLSFTVSADCSEDCQAEYEECMEVSEATGKAKICGEILRECKLACAEAGE